MARTSRFERGQIWYFSNQPKSSEKSTNLIVGRRPGIILSTALIATIVPCSHNGGKLKTHVPIVFNRADVSYALCEQAMPVDFSRLTSYICTVDDEKVDEITQMVSRWISGEFNFENIFWSDNAKTRPMAPLNLSRDEKREFITLDVSSLKQRYNLSADIVEEYQRIFENEFDDEDIGYGSQRIG